jgi:hypothetical protein
MKAVVLFFFYTILFSSCSFKSNKPVEGWCGYGSYDEKRTYYRIIDRINSLHSRHVTITIIGTVTYGSEAYPIYDVYYNHGRDDKQNALITGCVHGNEPAGAEAVLEYVSYLNRTGSLLHYKVHFIPVVNPWGWSHNIRFNGNGYDINRDFNSFKTEEAKIITKYFSNKVLDLIIDLHETGSNGNFIYNYSTLYLDKAVKLIDFLYENKLRIDNGYKDHSFQVNDGILDYPSLLIYFQSWFSRSPLAHYFYIHHNNYSFTFESSVYEPLRDRIKAHKAVMIFFLEK